MILFLSFFLIFSNQRSYRTFSQNKIKSRAYKSNLKKQDIRTNIPDDASEKTNFILPENLTDGNQDGFADEGDFIRSFANLGLSPWELKQIFLMVDISQNGQIDGHEWRNFHDMFIIKFTAADKNIDLLLNETEFISSFEDMPQMRQIVNDNTTMHQLMNDISGRQDVHNPGLNFFEWMFLRRCAIGWGIANSRQSTISKVELFDAALVIMLPFNQHDGQLKNQIYAALDFSNSQTQFSFLQLGNIFHKFLIWSCMVQHSALHGSITKQLLLKSIDDGIGPSDVFLISGQTKQATVQQAYDLLDDSEEIGLDFENFFLYMQVIYAVKQNALTNFGALTFDEFNSTIYNHPVFGGARPYIFSSYIMDGNYKRGYNFTLESEAHVLSQQKLQPVQNRFLQIMKKKRNYKSKQYHQQSVQKIIHDQHLKKSFRAQQKKQNTENELEHIDTDSKNMTLDPDPIIYFFHTFRSNQNDSYINVGDLYRLAKYGNTVAYWDQSFGPQTLLFYPEVLKMENIAVLPGVFFLKEKEIIREIISIYKGQKDLDQIQISLPMDLLGFSRFMNYDQLQTRVTKAKVGEDIAYSSLYIIFQRMGLIPFNIDLNDWLRDIFQGQRGFKIYNQTAQILEAGRKVVDGRQQFILSSIRSSKQKQALNQFTDSSSYMDPIIYSTQEKNDINRFVYLGANQRK